MQVSIYKDENRVRVNEDNTPVDPAIEKRDIKLYLVGPDTCIEGVTGEHIDVSGSFLANVRSDPSLHGGHRLCAWPITYSEENPRTKKIDCYEVGLGVTVPMPDSFLYRFHAEVRHNPNNNTLVFIVRDKKEYYMKDENLDIRGWEDGEILWQFSPGEDLGDRSNKQEEEERNSNVAK